MRARIGVSPGRLRKLWEQADQEAEIMRAQLTAAYLAGFGGGLAIAWIVEAFFVGRSVVSTYLGPVALVAIFANLFFRHRAGRGPQA
jgi:hypothetical protein